MVCYRSIWSAIVFVETESDTIINFHKHELYWKPRVISSLIVARQVKRKNDMFFAPLILRARSLWSAVVLVGTERWHNHQFPQHVLYWQPRVTASLIVARQVRRKIDSIKTQRIILKKFHCSSSLQNSGSQSFLSKSGSIHFCSFRNDSHIKGYAAKTAMQKHKCFCNTCGLCRVCADRSAFDRNKELIWRTSIVVPYSKTMVLKEFYQIWINQFWFIPEWLIHQRLCCKNNIAKTPPVLQRL